MINHASNLGLPIHFVKSAFFGASAAPDAVSLIGSQCIVKALFLDGAVVADTFGNYAHLMPHRSIWLILWIPQRRVLFALYSAYSLYRK